MIEITNVIPILIVIIVWKFKVLIVSAVSAFLNNKFADPIPSTDTQKMADITSTDTDTDSIGTALI